MVDLSFKSIVDLILGNLGTLVTLILILYGGHKKWWVWGWYAEELKLRNGKLESSLERLGRTASTATTLAETSVSALEQKTEARV